LSTPRAISVIAATYRSIDVFQFHQEEEMRIRVGSILLLAVFFALTTSVAAFASAPCGIANEIYCQGWDGSGNLYASQNDTTSGGFGNYATVYDHFTFSQAWNVQSFHFVGGYFNIAPPPFVSAVTLTFYNDNAGIPGNAIATGSFGSFNETLIGGQIYSYDLYFSSFYMGPGTYWASVVPDLDFPPQWGWATSSTGDGAGYQCYFGSCATVGGVNFAFAIDGTSPVPEPGTMVMLGTGILGLAGTLRRKLL
jgi:hypothetical protein